MSMLAAMRDSSEPQSLIACQALILILVPLDQKPTTQYRYGMESCDSSVQHTMYVFLEGYKLEQETRWMA